jgi:membrane-associated phospholipid phosphatase
VLNGAAHSFNLLSVPGNYSFPSGHMTLAGSFAGVFMSLYRVTLWPLSALLVLAAVLLVVGDWHFVSDVIAGTFLGVSVGILAGAAWDLHLERPS